MKSRRRQQPLVDAETEAAGFLPLLARLFRPILRSPVVKDIPVSKIEVTQVRGTSGQPPRTIAVLKALGLRRIGQTKVHKDNNCIRGMVNKVKHMISYKVN